MLETITLGAGVVLLLAFTIIGALSIAAGRERRDQLDLTEAQRHQDFIDGLARIHDIDSLRDQHRRAQAGEL